MEASIKTSTFLDAKVDNKPAEVEKENVVSQNQSIRSSAVVAYSASKQQPLFQFLALQTDLNLTPSNWLRSVTGLRPSSLISASKAHSTGMDIKNKSMFSSFAMADSHLEKMGFIDMVSDAENVKKLLKVPYSKSHVSMAVHRVGKTLLLDKFDTMQNAEQFRGWYNYVYDKLLQKPKGLKKKLRSAQLDALMNSKFLYYSVNPKEEDQQDYENVPSSSQPLQSQDACNDFEPDEETFFRQHFDIRDEFERKIFWTFEDLEMLLGTNMPIFGGREYPAVSLRLHDSQKPINILTGLDYWLDNLICNVPEVIMCFHVKGIVQNYKEIKTEDIPKMAESKFDPQVIKDIAQSILSFLKSKCTEEGHTYWLFKGSNDDVVKLYDLTMICDEDSSAYEKQNIINPFTLPVATLLYKMAFNLIKQNEVLGRQRKTIVKLLNNCVDLLKRKPEVSPAMLTGALSLLASLFIPLYKKSNDDSSSKCSTVSSYHSDENSTSAETTQLQGWIKMESDQVAIKYLVEGLNALEKCKDEVKVEGLLWTRHVHLMKVAISIYYIEAEHYFSDSRLSSALRCVTMAFQCYECLEHLLNHPVKLESQSGFNLEEAILVQVLEKVTELKFETLFPKLLVICGDIQLSVCSGKNLGPEKISSQIDEVILRSLKRTAESDVTKYQHLTSAKPNRQDAISACRECYQAALKATDQLLLQEGSPGSASLKVQSRGSGRRCERLKSNTQLEDLKLSITRKLGHVCNELAASQMSRTVELLHVKNSDDEDFNALWKGCLKNLETSQSLFVAVGDLTNEALVLSNLGKLMRICAQSVAQWEEGKFTDGEQKLYESAIDYYQKALSTHQRAKHKHGTIPGTTEDFTSVHENLQWELSGAYIMMAQRLQDNAPLEIKSREEIEKMISGLLGKALKICTTIYKDKERHKTCLYRCAKIHSRLASLHHNSSLHTDNATKRRQYRSLADSQYSKSCSAYEQLVDDHPTELLRTLLERIALHDQNISYITHASGKSRSALEGIGMFIACQSPLTVIQSKAVKFLSLSNTDETIDEDTVKDWSKVADLTMTIIKSLLHQLIKYTSQAAKPTTNKKRFGPPPHDLKYDSYKKLYAKVLRNIQSSSESSKTNAGNDVASLHIENVLLKIKSLLDITDDIKEFL